MLKRIRLILVALSASASDGLAWTGGQVSGDPGSTISQADFEKMIQDALPLVAKVNPTAAQDLQGLLDDKQHPLYPQISPLDPIKGGGVTASTGWDGSYMGGGGLGGWVNIRIDWWGKEDPSQLCGTLLHEWEHWKGDKADGVQDGDDGTINELPENATPAQKLAYEKHVILQMQVAMNMCNANCIDPASLWTCQELGNQFNKALEGYMNLGNLAGIGSVGGFLSSLKGECCCSDFVQYF